MRPGPGRGPVLMAEDRRHPRHSRETRPQPLIHGARGRIPRRAPGPETSRRVQNPEFLHRHYLGFVDFDNEAGGAMGADELARLVGNEGVVLETRGSVGSAQAQLRHKGFNDCMASAYSTIEVRSLNTEWAADNAYSMVLDAFTQNPDIKGVFSHNDEMVRGIVSALRQIGKLIPTGEGGHVAVVGLDGTPLGLDRIREGTQDASVGQDPIAMGGAILDQMIAYFEGESYEPFAVTQPVLINADNVNDPTHWGNFQQPLRQNTGANEAAALMRLLAGFGPGSFCPNSCLLPFG